MSNILTFTPKPRRTAADTLVALCAGVAHDRRLPDDVFWLKENAELLGILAATNAELPVSALEPYQEFYDQIEEKLRFYPQYYRFFVSICLDLEDLGLDGCKGASLCGWAASVGLADAELSDLQRAEARRLLARRGAAKPVSEGALGDRLHNFMERPATFALPNKKAAYELTHIVFYLSEYGACDPELSEAAITSLEYTGVIAYLDQDHDLLAEVCVALRFAGRTPSDIWTQAVAAAHARITPMASASVDADGYHAYLVTGWAQAVAGGPCFEAEIPGSQLFFADPGRHGSALRPLSECLLGMGAARRGNWTGMRGQLIPYLDPTSCDILAQAEASTDKFGGFFEEFARAAGA
jgi:hypothetical protein